MNCSWSTALLWIALALLPLRGYASVVMHLPAADAAAAVMPCHGGTAPGAGSTVDVAPPADADSAAGTENCSMCDLCHGACAISSSSPDSAVFLPPRVAAFTPPAAGHQTPLWLRPPRG